MTEEKHSSLTAEKKEKIDFLFGMLLLCVIPFILSPPAQAVFQVTDLPEFWCGARLFVEGKAAQIYQPDLFFACEKSFFPALNDRAIPLYAAPYGLPFLTPYLLFPASIAYQGIKIFLLLCFGLALRLIMRWQNFSARSFMWTAAFISFWGPAWEAVRIEQISPMLFISLALTLTFLQKQKHMAAAISLSPFLLKPHLVAPIWCFLLGARYYRFCLSFFAICAAVAAITLVLPGCGIEAYKSYSQLLSQSMVNMVWMAPSQTPTLRGQLLRLPFLPTTPSTLACTGIFFVVLVILFLMGRRKSDNQLDRLVLAAIPLGLIFSLHCFAYDLILLLPALTVAAKKLLQSSFKSAPVLVPALLLLALPVLTFTLPFYAFIHYIFTLQGSIINWHFVSLALLVFYLVNQARRLPTSS